MIKAVIFDVDGTLVDSVEQHARSWQDAFRVFGHEIDLAAIQSQIGKGGDQLLPVFLGAAEIDAIGVELDKSRATFLRERYLPQIRAFPHVRALFERIIHDGKHIVLASSASSGELQQYKAIANVADLLDDETSSDDAEESKPHPDISQAALDKLGGINPDNAIVVGDTPYDAEAAGKARLRTIGLLCSGWPTKALKTAGCVAAYHDPADLLQSYATSPLST